jgi:excisionase family DNA binding protein
VSNLLKVNANEFDTPGKYTCDSCNYCDSQPKEVRLDGLVSGSRVVPDGNVYTVREVAELLRVHKCTIYRDVESGRIDAFRVGKGRGTIRISDAALSEYQRRAPTRPDDDARLLKLMSPVGEDCPRNPGEAA